MSLDFIARALLAGIGIASVAGPLGAIMVWRRMANFGDALAHSTLLGLCFALLMNINLYVGLTSVCLLVASLLAVLSKQKNLGNDTILSMLAYFSLAIGLILATLLKNVRIDLLGYLYGDILSVNNTDLIWIYSTVILVFLSLLKIWKSIIAITVHEDLAIIEGFSVQKTKWIVVLLMAMVFSVAMKLIGVLLMTALLIIPAASARQISRTPETMAVMASLLGMLSVFGGIKASFYWDWPTGPAIVVVAMVLFLLCRFSQEKGSSTRNNL